MKPNVIIKRLSYVKVWEQNKYNISDNQALCCFVLIVLKMPILSTLFWFSVGNQGFYKKRLYGCYVQTVFWRGFDIPFPCEYEMLEKIV